MKLRDASTSKIVAMTRVATAAIIPAMLTSRVVGTTSKLELNRFTTVSKSANGSHFVPSPKMHRVRRATSRHLALHLKVSYLRVDGKSGGMSKKCAIKAVAQLG